MSSRLSDSEPRMASLSEDRMLKLMAYADGELEGHEREEVEQWLSTDVDAVRFANELAGLGELVKMGHEGSRDAKAIASFSVVDDVMAAVAKEKPAGAPVVSLAARRAKNTRLGLIVAGLALAASFFLMTRHKDEAPLAGAPLAAAPPASASAEPGVDVDLVETAGDSVRVFYLSTENSPTTSVVVWVDEPGGK